MHKFDQGVMKPMACCTCDRALSWVFVSARDPYVFSCVPCTLLAITRRAVFFKTCPYVSSSIPRTFASPPADLVVNTHSIWVQSHSAHFGHHHSRDVLYNMFSKWAQLHVPHSARLYALASVSVDLISGGWWHLSHSARIHARGGFQYNFQMVPDAVRTHYPHVFAVFVCCCASYRLTVNVWNGGTALTQIMMSAH